MIHASRTYSDYSTPATIRLLDGLLESTSNPQKYRTTMHDIGIELGKCLSESISNSSCLVVSTAEDADFLSKGIIESISSNASKLYTGVFWNNHYQVSDGSSVAPVVHKYLQPGFQESKNLIVAKSVLSGSCVVRTNILALIDELDKDTSIFIVSPVLYKEAEQSLRGEFPEEISSRFKFVYFAKDADRNEASGEVTPGIGGMIYQLLGLSEQPVRTGYMPQLVKDALSTPT